MLDGATQNRSRCGNHAATYYHESLKHPHERLPRASDDYSCGPTTAILHSSNKGCTRVFNPARTNDVGPKPAPAKHRGGAGQLTHAPTHQLSVTVSLFRAPQANLIQANPPLISRGSTLRLCLQSECARYNAQSSARDPLVDPGMRECRDRQIDGRVQSILIGGHDVSSVLARDDYWYCQFFDNYDCEGDSSDQYLTFADGVNNLASIGWGVKIHSLRCCNQNPAPP
ncbi:hypothetical protein OPT61_g5865 [Boeremia exigua]|uniref:Uncharacterized protein n=1 Tax=Boeremia exigua TaxID=749465 RepID=A0ACC2I8T2_9PLEO|nr:hypothetical protein OPT61_g5865 [Boeremia exigua]